MHGYYKLEIQDATSPRCNFYKEGIPTTNNTAPKCYKMVLVLT